MMSERGAMTPHRCPDSDALHAQLTVVDGLIVSDFGPSVFNDMRKGGITAANCTCCIWEGFTQTMHNIMQWKTWFREFPDLIVQVKSATDIRRAKAEDRTGIILGWQNISGMEDQLGYLSLFKDLGVGIIQMAYNTQNLVATGCYESHDAGLSDFGREVVAEMNRLRILCDLSHVGSVSSRDIILASDQRVAYSHCLPAGLKSHPRNKSDEELRFIVDHGGFVGVTMFTPFLARGADATVDDYVEAMEYVINICGEDSVGYGTDFTQGHDQPFFHWITHDKGYSRRLTDFGTIRNPTGLDSIGQTGALTATMLRRGWSEIRIQKVMGENWVSLLEEVWGN